MSHYYSVPNVGSGTADDPVAPEGYDRVRSGPEHHNLHSRRGHYVIAANHSLSVYEQLADDPHSGVQRLSDDEIDGTPSPADEGRYENTGSDTAESDDGEESSEEDEE